jgi:single stranded DNA-binding protein
MASNLNMWVGSGRATSDPTINRKNPDNPVCKFSLAVIRSRNVNDEWVDEVSYLDFVAFGRLAERVYTKVRKGNRMTIHARVSQNKWTDAETEKVFSRIEFVCESVEAEAFFLKTDDVPARDEQPEETPAQTELDELREKIAALEGAAA